MSSDYDNLYLDNSGLGKSALLPFGETERRRNKHPVWKVARALTTNMKLPETPGDESV